ncbi:MAG TPA: hypothetical protein VFB36_04265 [Nevskiaceae bacterium]|nr:hypothetical protein [Nevskiaceae bacterium]
MASLVARAVVLIALGEALLLTLGFLLDRRLTRGARLHGVVVMGALFATLTPIIADGGCARVVAELPALPRWIVVAGAAALAQAGLWAITFFGTGLLLDALRRQRPTPQFSVEHWSAGLVRGAIYGAVFMLIVQLAAFALAQPSLVAAIVGHPRIGGALIGAILFPLGKTVLGSFDGSAPFFERLRNAFVDPRNYLRGAIAGAAIGELLAVGLPAASSAKRFGCGVLIGVAAYTGADLVWDLGGIALRRRLRLQSWRVYALAGTLGGFVGGALAWYFDAPQLAAVIAKFHRYAAVSFAAAGLPVSDYVDYPLFSKWGATNLGATLGGVGLFYRESLSGVLNWSLAAPLFGVNVVVLNALFQRSWAPLRALASRGGIETVVEQTVRVLRWGLWMAPIIYTFLRQSPDPTWYNQDGAIRTLVATLQSFILSPADFRTWSLTVFLGLLAYDWLRVLIWFDHMGLRVATLVNLSFVGGDALDEKAARFIGHSGRTRCIPEGIRRFLTWAPLLIPFYIPRGADWDFVWTHAEALHKSGEPTLPAVVLLMYGYRVVALLLTAGAATLIYRKFVGRPSGRRVAAARPFVISNGLITSELHLDGSGYTRVISQVRKGYVLDLTQRPEEPLPHRGKRFELRERDERWSLLGAITRVSPTELRIVDERRGIRAEAILRVADGSAQETWHWRFTNLEARARQIEITSFQEIALSGVDAYRRTPAFAAIHVGTWFARSHSGIFYRNRLLRNAESDFRLRRMSREVGYHRVELGDRARLVGYQDSRAHRGVMRDPSDEGLLYTFDPIASLRVQVDLAANGSADVSFVDGYLTDLPDAVPSQPRRILIPASRPWSHLYANLLGHGAVVRNDGESFSFAANAQQNVLALERWPGATQELRCGLGYATLVQQLEGASYEVTAFATIDEPVEVRIVRADSKSSPIAPKLDFVLAEVPADRGVLETHEEGGAKFYRNPRNDFHKGWAFTAASGSTIVIGQEPTLDDARRLIEKYRDPQAAQRALDEVRRFWSEELGALHIETDRPDFDRLVNEWLPYQIRCARLWGRTGPDQRSGAFGFRDQLQDVLPLVFTQPQRAREQILLHARQQFREGDVVKWWHRSWEGKIGIAVRTAASDPHLWLPYVVARYVAATGDDGVLDERLPFLEGRKLPRGQEGVMFVPRESRDDGTLYEHCRRAIEWSLARLGAHGIPLLGSGDWNDGLDVAGLLGRGESGWLGFFLFDVLTSFVPIAQRIEGEGAARRYRDAAMKLRDAMEAFRRGDAYVRLTTDEGEEMAAANALMAAWPVLSGAVDLDRGLAVLESSLRELERGNLVKLEAAPFTEDSHPYPGRVADYPPGVRENAGQYSHGVSWIVDAYLRCADLAHAARKADLARRCRDRAAEIWIKISPLSKTDPIYGLTPHQQPADVYDGPGYEGRGGWSWYTGAAARMLSAAYSLLGLRMERGELKLDAHAFAAKGGIQLKRVTWRGRTLVGE